MAPRLSLKTLSQLSAVQLANFPNEAAGCWEPCAFQFSWEHVTIPSAGRANSSADTGRFKLASEQAHRKGKKGSCFQGRQVQALASLSLGPRYSDTSVESIPRYTGTSIAHEWVEVPMT